MALDFQRPDPSSPAAVASAQFSQTRRGYREEEVRDFLRQVSVEMARLLERERFLENELTAIKARGPIDVSSIDEATITELLGAEAAKVLSTAREAAQVTRDRAAESAEQIVREASREAARMLEESTLEASRRRTDVSSEAEQELELAKQQGREIVAEVRAYRERVLADIAKRTEDARRELERLVHERERLLSAFEKARHAASDVVGDLTGFEEAIRATGIVPPLVPPDAPPPPRPTRTSDTPIFDAKQYLDELGTAHRPETATEQHGGDQSENGQPESNRDHVDVAEDDVVATVSESSAPDTTDGPDVVPSGQITGVGRDPVDAERIGEDMAEVVNLSDRRRKKDAKSATVVEPTVPPESEHPVFERVEPQPATESVVPASSRVDEIFERLRSATPKRVADETSRELATAKSTAVQPPDVDTGAFRRRDETVNAQLEAMLRVAKRRISDDENSLLTHIGTKRSKLTIEAMLPTVDDHARQLAGALDEHVTGIAVDAARSLRESRRSEMRNVVRDGQVLEAVTSLLSIQFTKPMHDQIASAIANAAGERDVLMRLVRDVCTEWKSRHSEPVVADVAHLAYARGLFLGCDRKTKVCWAVDPNGPACADAEDNALAGMLDHSEHFPTGQAHPLAHAGCRCLVVPIDK